MYYLLGIPISIYVAAVIMRLHLGVPFGAAIRPYFLDFYFVSILVGGRRGDTLNEYVNRALLFLFGIFGVTPVDIVRYEVVRWTNMKNVGYPPSKKIEKAVNNHLNRIWDTSLEELYLGAIQNLKEGQTIEEAMRDAFIQN